MHRLPGHNNKSRDSVRHRHERTKKTGYLYKVADEPLASALSFKDSSQDERMEDTPGERVHKIGCGSIWE